MGDRGNIVVLNKRQDGSYDRVCLYTHWRGFEIKDILRQALSLRERWNDEQYLARIIFDVMTRGEAGTTGYGIGAQLGDNERRVLFVDCISQTVIEADELEALRSWRDRDRPSGTESPFSEWATVDD